MPFCRKQNNFKKHLLRSERYSSVYCRSLINAAFLSFNHLLLKTCVSRCLFSGNDRSTQKYHVPPRSTFSRASTNPPHCVLSTLDLEKCIVVIVFIVVYFFDFRIIIVRRSVDRYIYCTDYFHWIRRFVRLPQIMRLERFGSPTLCYL